MYHKIHQRVGKTNITISVPFRAQTKIQHDVASEVIAIKSNNPKSPAVGMRLSYLNFLPNGASYFQIQQLGDF